MRLQSEMPPHPKNDYNGPRTGPGDDERDACELTGEVPRRASNRSRGMLEHLLREKVEFR
jgi:hypothetical protein